MNKQKSISLYHSPDTKLTKLNNGGLKEPMEEKEKAKFFIITPEMEKGHPLKTLWQVYLTMKKRDDFIVRYRDKSDNKKIAAWLISELPFVGMYPQGEPEIKKVCTLNGDEIEVFEIVFKKAKFVFK